MNGVTDASIATACSIALDFLASTILTMPLGRAVIRRTVYRRTRFRNTKLACSARRCGLGYSTPASSFEINPFQCARTHAPHCKAGADTTWRSSRRPRRPHRMAARARSGSTELHPRRARDQAQDAASRGCSPLSGWLPGATRCSMRLHGAAASAVADASTRALSSAR